MVKIFVVSVITVGLGYTAQAQSVESFNLGSLFLIEKCTATIAPDGSSQTTCVQAAGDTTVQNSSIALSNCSPISGGTMCSGDLSSSLTADGYTFGSDINVSATNNGSKTYSSTAVITSQGQTTLPLMVLFPAGAKFTDAAILIGNSVQSSTDPAVTYTPGLGIGPATGVKIEQAVKKQLQLKLLR